MGVHAHEHAHADTRACAKPYLTPYVQDPWVGLWAQPPIFVQKHLHTQKMLQTPKDEDWAGVAQPAWTRPGFESTED